MSYIFSKTNSYDENDATVELACPQDTETWPELTEYFLNFLRGCGFVLNTRDFLEELQSKIADLHHAENPVQDIREAA